MYYVNPNEVLKLFTAYIEEYGDTLSRDEAIGELRDALNSAECEWIEQTMRQSKWFYVFLVMTAICATTLFIAFEPYMLFTTIASAFFTITHKA